MSFAERKFAYPLFLGTLFIAAFTIPVFFFINLRSSEIVEDDVDEEGDMQVTVAVPDVNNYIRVPSSEALNPDQESDFILWIWFRLKKLPDEAEPVVFLVKMDAKVRANPGYTLGVTRDGDKILPIVYWRDEHGRGASHTFADMKILPRDWSLLVLSFTNGKFLSLNGYSVTATSPAAGAQASGTGQSQLLGAYDLEPPVYAITDAPLIVGALQNGRFRGKIGPFGILKAQGLAKKLPEVLKNIIASPYSNPLPEKNSALSLFISDEERDSSEFQHEVQNRSARVRRKRKEHDSKSEEE